MKASRNCRAIVATLLALACPAGWSEEAANPPLRASRTLSPKKAPDETERALLRLEAKVGQTLIDDRALLKDILARLDRIAATVADLHKLLVAMPAGGPCKPVTATCPTVVAPTGTAGGGSLDSLGELPWLPIAGGAGVLALLGLLWQRRRRTRAEVADGKFAPTQPPAATAATPAGTPSVQVAAAAVAGKSVAQPPAQAGHQAAAAPMADAISMTPPVAADGSAPAGENGGEADLSLELADVMLSMGLTDGAAQTLADHIRSHPRQALYHWLKLLDIYRRSGMKTEFENAARELQQHFNMAPPEWSLPIADPSIKTLELESYGHISSRIQELWPRRSCSEYLSRLLEDNRGGTRTGFPQAVVEEILLLIALLRDLGR